MHRILLSIILLFCFSLSRAQVLQEMFFQIGDPKAGKLETVNKLIRTADGGFLLGGQWNDGQAFLRKYNHCGDSLWQRTYAFGTASEFRDLLERTDGSLLAVGACSQCSPQPDTGRNALLVKIGASGELISDHRLDDPGETSWINAITAGAGGGFALTGARRSVGDTRAFIARFDEALNQQWIRYFHFLPRNEGKDIIQTQDEGYAICGQARDADQAGQGFMIKTDAGGNQEWSFSDAQTGLSGNALAEESDGNLLLTGEVDLGAEQRVDLFILRVNAGDGSRLNYRTYGARAESDLAGYNDAANDLHLLPNGHLLVGGGFGLSFNYHSGWILQLDEQFNLARRWDFSDPFGEISYIIKSVVPLDSTGEQFAFAGDRLFPNGQHDGVLTIRQEAGRLVGLQAMPRHGQIYPRNRQDNLGTIRVAGKVRQALSPYQAMRLRVFREGVLHSPEQTFPLNFVNGEADFSFTYRIPAELANYRVELWGWDGAQAHLEACARDVAAGDAFLIVGQSNAVANFGEEVEEKRHPFIRVYGSGNKSRKTWFPGDPDGSAEADGNLGNWGGRMAHLLLETYQVPIAALNGGWGGAESDFFLPEPEDPTNPESNYGALLERAREAGLTEGISAIFWFQGETDVLNHNQTGLYKERLQTLYQAWKRDYPGFGKLYLIQIRSTCFEVPAYNALPIMEAQRQLAAELPGAALMSTTALEHDGCHFPYAGGYRTLGERLFRLVARDFYGAGSSNVEVPDPAGAVFSDSLEITLTMKNEADTLVWQEGAGEDFFLEGSTERVISGRTEGHRLILTLSGCPEGMTGISYAGHLYTATPFVTNGAGVGMATFRNLPLSPPPGCRPVKTRDTRGAFRDIRVWPNPTNDRINIAGTLGRQTDAIHLELLNAGGQAVSSRTAAPLPEFRETVDLRGYPAGLYWLRLESSAGHWTGRVVKF